MKKIFVLLLSFMLIVLSSCSSPQNNAETTEETAVLTESESTESVSTEIQSEETESEVAAETEETKQTEVQSTEEAETQEENKTMTDINVTVNGIAFQGKIYNDSPCAQQFLDKLPLTLTMNELNGNEKYYRFSEAFTSSPESVGSINLGDIMLYQSDYLVLFYDSFNTSYTYTRLGYITDTAGLKEAVGTGNAEITFEIA